MWCVKHLCSLEKIASNNKRKSRTNKRSNKQTNVDEYFKGWLHFLPTDTHWNCNIRNYWLMWAQIHSSLCLEMLMILLLVFRYCNCCTIWWRGQERTCVHLQWRSRWFECHPLPDPGRTVGRSHYAPQLWVLAERSHRCGQKWISRSSAPNGTLQ